MLFLVRCAVYTQKQRAQDRGEGSGDVEGCDATQRGVLYGEGECFGFTVDNVVAHLSAFKACLFGRNYHQPPTNHQPPPFATRPAAGSQVVVVRLALSSAGRQQHAINAIGKNMEE